MGKGGDAGPKDVKVSVPAGLPVRAKLVHVLAVLVSGLIALAVSAVLADGTSVIKLKSAEFLPIVTNKTLKAEGIYYRLDQLLGDTYGIGLHHDQSGRSWDEVGGGSTVKELVAELGIPVIAAAIPSVIATDGLKHPVPLLSCDDLKMAGQTAMSFGFIALIVAIVMIIFHSAALAGLVPSKPAKILGGLVWLTLSAGFLIVIMLAVGIYTSVWTCHNPIIPKIKLSEHFQYNYGFAFAIIGFVSSVTVSNAVLCFTSMDDDEAAPSPPKCPAVKAVGGASFGLVLGAVACIVTLSAAGNFDAEAPKDPNINPCEGKKPYHAGPGDNYFSNVDCFRNTVAVTLEQAGGNVTRGYVGGMDAGSRVPILEHYEETDLCPVNVHWHLGAEHLSIGQYDHNGKGPMGQVEPEEDYDGRRELAEARLGHRCHHYNENDVKFTVEYDWQHCESMHVGETYEVHWPHSAAGSCGTEWQYQTPFYDGVFCKDGVITIAPLNTYEKIGVQGQVFTIVNSDEPQYQHDNLIAGMVVDPSANMGIDIAKYTGSTTGTSRDNVICSRYTPITWQVDRKCHMISAKSFDKLCQDMKGMRDDMSADLHAHGAREVVAHHLTANNQQSRKALRK